MKKTFRTMIISLMAVLMLLTSCNDKLQKMDEGSINEYIYPYVKFEPAEDGNSVTAVVVAGAKLDIVKIPATVDGLKVNEFIGFENPEDAESVTEIVVGSQDTVITDEALKQAINLEKVKVERTQEIQYWGKLPTLEKDGYEFLGWYAGDDKVFEGMMMDPENTVAVPVWRAHKYIHHEGKEPTCTEAGWKPYNTCETCDYNDKVELPALGHDFKHVDRIPPTCTENGQIEHYICTRCGWLFSAPDPEARINDVVIKAEGHKLQHYPAKAATCTGIGYDEHWVCSVCGKYFIEDADEAYKEVAFADIKKDPVGHPWNSEWSYDNTQHWHECPVCGEKTDIEDHVWENPEIIQAPTDDIPGKVKYTCKCGAVDIRTLEPENHEFKLVDSKSPSCTEPGFRDYMCIECGLTYRDIIPALGHKPEKVERVEPTCQREGNVEHWFCPQCGNRYGSADCNEESLIENGNHVLPKVDHKFEGEWLSNENGHYRMCSFGCGTSSDVIPHVFDQEVASNEYIYSSPTCTKPGIYYKSCICGYKSSSETFMSTETKDKPLGHDLVHHPASTDKPSCAEGGNIEYWECSRCGLKFSDAACTQEITDIRGKHIQDGWDVTKPGFHRPRCKVCHEGYGEWVPHTESGWHSDKSGHWKECEICGAIVEQKVSHTFEIKDGKKVCSVCGFVDEENITGGDFDVSTDMKLPKGTLEYERDGNALHVEFRNANRDYPATSFQWFVMDELVESNETGKFSCDVSSPRNYRIMCLFSNEWGKNSESIDVIGGMSSN